MIKKRIIASVILQNNLVVRGLQFKKYYPIGKIKYVIESLNRWGVDEIAIIDISATKSKIINCSIIKEAANLSNVPILYSGGITSINQIKKILSNGADKVMINNITHNNINKIKEFSNYFGRQCIVLSIDILKKNNKYFLYNYLYSKIYSDINLQHYIDEISKLFVGEIFFNFVNNSGMSNGIDLNLLKFLPAKCNIPIIIGGGIGNPYHVIEAFSNPNVNAVSIGNSINFYEHSIVLIKSFLKKNGINIRLDTEFNYLNHKFKKSGFLNKLDSSTLNKLIFKIHKDENI